MERAWPQALIIGVVVGCCIWWGACQWKECRDAGFSRFYCAQHVG